jgi:hypothetical protein
LPKKEGERERKKKKNEGEYRGMYSRDWNSAVLAYRLYGGLSDNERNTTETLKLPSKWNKIRERIKVNN